MKNSRIIALSLTLLLLFSIFVTAVSAMQPADSIKVPLSDAKVAALLSEAETNSSFSDEPLHPADDLKTDITLSGLLQNYHVVEESSSVSHTSSGEVLYITNLHVEPDTTAATEENTVSPKYVPCPVGPGPCGQDVLLSVDVIYDENQQIRYFVMHYGCRMCKTISYSEVVWPK